MMEDSQNKIDKTSDGIMQEEKEEEIGEQIRILLTLAPEFRHEHDQLQVPVHGPLAVPAHLGRKGLSAVINHLLNRKIESQEEQDDENDEDAKKDDNDRDEDQLLPAIPFDFIVGKIGTTQGPRLLRTGLEKEARRNGLSLEEAIPITYFPASQEPQSRGNSEPVPDWISTLVYVGDSSNNSDSHKSNHKYLFSGLYDGSIYCFRAGSDSKEEKDAGDGSGLQTLAVQSKAHKGPIKCMDAALVTSGNDSANAWIATGSMDHSLLIHKVQIGSHLRDSDKSASRWTASCMHYATCAEGHASTVGCVDLFSTSHGTTQKIWLASGDWDGGVCLWSVPTDRDDDGDDDESSKKKSKISKTGSILSSTAASPQNRQGKAVELAPKVSIQAHASKTSAVSWGNHLKHSDTQTAASASSALPLQLITASWDHSVKVWDVERQDCLLTLNGSRVITCMDSSYHSPGIVATGHPDCTVRLWDLRINNNSNQSKSPQQQTVQTISDHTFRPSHKAWISAVQWSRHDSPFHLASASHDGTVKLWDIRSPLPLHTVRVFSDRFNKNKKFPPVAGGGEDPHKALSLVYGDKSSRSLFVGGTDCIVKQFQCPQAAMSGG